MAQKNCENCMLCGTLSGLLVLIAGSVMLLAGLNILAGTASTMIAGLALALYGLGALVHTANICPLCK